jgi:hypothetical protein
LIETKWIEIINRQLDGELSEKEEAELVEYIKKNQEAQQFYSEQRRMIRYLNGVPEVNPPAGLKNAVMTGISESAHMHHENRPAPVLDSRNWFSRETMKVIISHAAFLLIGFGIAAYFIQTSSSKPLIDLNQLSGTIGLTRQALNQSGFVNTVEFQQFKGHVDQKQNKSEAWIKFNFSSGNEYKINLIYDPQVLCLRVFIPSDSKYIFLENTEKKLAVHSEGSFFLAFTKLESQRSDLKVEITEASGKIERFVLKVNDQ